MACTVFGHRPTFWSDGSTMLWECSRCGRERGAKEYASAEQAETFAAAFDHRDDEDLGRLTEKGSGISINAEKIAACAAHWPIEGLLRKRNSVPIPSGRALLRPPDRPVRTQGAVHADAGHLHRGRHTAHHCDLEAAIGGIVEIFFGVKAEGAKLEDITEPLTAEAASSEGADD